MATMSMEERRGSYGNSMMAQLTPVVKKLLILNLVLYFADLLILDFAIRKFGAFTIQSGILEGRIWEFITFQFIHGSVGHVLFNSIGLFFFGPWMERWWGAKKFVFFYLACGVGGALFYTLLVYLGVLQGETIALDRSGRTAYIPASMIPLVGASAGIYGILIGVAVIAPSLRVALLIPPVTLTMRQLALGLLVISAGLIVFKIGGNEGGEAGHLGGAIVGFFLMKLAQIKDQGGLGTLPFFQGKSKGPRTDIEPKIRPRTRVDLRSQTEIDEILDKISKDGFQSLTAEERDILHRAAKSEEG
ncbi:MAG: rhomboid family intramembrane serine protease [Akkermansiaceae bacterium]